MDAAPARLVVQTRAWDFVADIDKPHYCDAMTTLDFDVLGKTVAKRTDAPCDALDLRACCATTIGTI